MKRRCPEWMTKVALPRYREPVPYGEAVFGSRIFPEPLSKYPSAATGVDGSNEGLPNG